jgi:methylated-DNA-[protein]-cysteine S-methyltransferase
VQAHTPRTVLDLHRSPEALAHAEEAREAFEAYFQGHSQRLDLCLDLEGITSFEQRVLELLRSVPYGTVTTYGELARELALGPDRARAVGQAVGSNPLPVVIPCHRVIRGDGRLGGFSGGLERKVELLRLEGVDVGGPYPDSLVTPGGLRLPL